MVYTSFNLDKEPKTIIEVGSWCGGESRDLKIKYPNSNIITYEIDPKKHNSIKKTIENYDITFKPYGLSDRSGLVSFYKFIGYDNNGADSLFPRYNGDMKLANYLVQVSTLKEEMIKLKIDNIDLLCLDTQGSELNILKGLEEYISKVNNIILEIPDVNMDTTEFKIPKNKDSVYDGAGNSFEIINFLNKNGFIEKDRKRENDLESNVLFVKNTKNILQFDCVFTAVNDNKMYLKYIPNFIKTWSYLFPEIEIIILFIGYEIPSYLLEYKKYIKIFKPLLNLDTAYIAQNIRIYYPSILNKKGVLITDIDIYPLNRNYYIKHLQNKLGNIIISYRPKTCVEKDQIAICYNIASSNTWKKINGCGNLEDICNNLILNYPSNYGEYRPAPLDWLKFGWFKDQEELYRMVVESKINIEYIGDADFNRIDKLNQTFEKVEKLKNGIKNLEYSDFIPLRDDNPDYKRINNFIVDSLIN